MSGAAPYPVTCLFRRPLLFGLEPRLQRRAQAYGHGLRSRAPTVEAGTPYDFLDNGGRPSATDILQEYTERHSEPPRPSSCRHAVLRNFFVNG